MATISASYLGLSGYNPCPADGYSEVLFFSDPQSRF